MTFHTNPQSSSPAELRAAVLLFPEGNILHWVITKSSLLSYFRLTTALAVTLRCPLLLEEFWVLCFLCRCTLYWLLGITAASKYKHRATFIFDSYSSYCLSGDLETLETVNSFTWKCQSANLCILVYNLASTVSPLKTNSHFHRLYPAELRLCIKHSTLHPPLC